MAYLTGLITEPVFDKHVDIENESLERKLVSVCKDIVFLSSRGEKQTPKHVALAMTVRHWTGSAKVIDFLNGLGHSVSSSYVLQRDTAQANKQLERKTLTPEGFDKNKFTTLVFDNNDFPEETVRDGHHPLYF